MSDRTQLRVPSSGSQNALILAALADGEWMSTAEVHRVAGFSRLNSRIAELRSYGYDIPSRHVPGQSGPHGTEYRLVPASCEASVSAATGVSLDVPACVPPSDGGWDDGDAGASFYVQLRLVA